MSDTPNIVTGDFEAPTIEPPSESAAAPESAGKQRREIHDVWVAGTEERRVAQSTNEGAQELLPAEEEPAAEEDDDFWAEEDEDDFWADEEAPADDVPSGPDTEFSDAVALQFPLKNPAGVRQPYFIFGDAQNAVDLWFVDLAGPTQGIRYEGRGSSALTLAQSGEMIETSATYDNGEWSVLFKRKRKSGGLSFDEGSFLPMAFSVWDGFNRERGNRRGLSAWYQVYVEPIERPSPVGPMARAGVTVLGLELLFIAMVRRRGKKDRKQDA